MSAALRFDRWRFDDWRFDDSTAEIDPVTGWLTVEGTAALVGVMDYEGGESEFVPPETLADFETLLAVPVTVQHPPKNLDLETTRKYQTGTVLSAKMDGDKLRVRLRITDAEAVAAYQAGTVELSPGYMAEISRTPGHWNGKKYTAVQTKRRYNHLALVDRARGGREARLDSWRADGALIQKRDAMETVTIDGVEFQVPPEVAAIVTAWQASQEPAADAVEPAADAAGATAPSPAPAAAAPAAKTPSSITVKMDAATLKKEIVEELTAAWRSDRDLERKNAAALGETIALVRPLLPQSYRVDGKDAGTLIADALVAKKPELAGWVKAHRTDGSMLRGALDMLLTGEKPIETTEHADSSDDEVAAAQAEQEKRMVSRKPLAAVAGGKT